MPASAIPTKRIIIDRPFVERWDDPHNNIAPTWQPQSDIWPPYWDWVVLPDDGVMGAQFYRFGDSGSAPLSGHVHGWNFMGPIFDQRKPYKASYRIRSNAPGGGYWDLDTWVDVPRWLGTSVIYSGEGSYGGGVNTSEGSSPYTSPLRSYGNPMLSASLLNNQPMDFEVEWDPISASIKCRVGLTDEIVMPISGYKSPQWPITSWWGSYADPINFDIGPITFTGARIWGAQDDFGWLPWIRSNVTVTPSSDCLSWQGGAGETSFKLGGISGASASLWWAVSPFVGRPPGFKYGELRIWESTAGTSGTHVKVYVRKSDGTSIFTSSSNDVDVYAASTGSARTWEKSGTRVYDLSSVTDEIYLDVVGVSQSVQLGGIWVTFDPTLYVNATASNGKVGGVRTEGSSVSLTSPSVTFGAVSYPTAETWEAAVSGSTGNVPVTASAGTDTFSALVLVPEASFSSTVVTTTAGALEILGGTPTVQTRVLPIQITTIANQLQFIGGTPTIEKTVIADIVSTSITTEAGQLQLSSGTPSIVVTSPTGLRSVGPVIRIRWAGGYRDIRIQTR